MLDRLPFTANNRRIREAIDSYPGGICFAYPHGMPILVNPVMNHLCYRLTGHTILNASRTWEILCGTGPLREGRRLPGLFEPFTEQETLPMFELEDRTVWQMNREELNIDGVCVHQYTAENVTELYNGSKRLYEANCRARDHHEQQKRILQNIAQINEDKERLQAKIRIHDDFGRCLIATRNMLKDDSAPTEPLLEEWENTIRSMRNLSGSRERRVLPSPREELLHVAELIGCRVEFCGEQPRERTPLLLMYAAIREALTNAVRHGAADCLTVEMSEKARSYLVRISDNGTASQPVVREGAGLTNLRRRLEQEGAQMEMLWESGVVMQLTLPKEG